MSEISLPDLDGIFEKSTETAQVKVNLLQLRWALKTNPEMFMHFFLSEALTEEVPDFHKEVFTEMTMEDVIRLLILIPRGHAKTMLAKLAAAWYLIFSEFRFVIYVSGSHDLVVPYVNDIAEFFRSDNFRAVFGGVEWLIAKDGEGIYKFRILATGKICILRGLGAGQRVRGINVDNERPQLAICDDIEDDEDVGSETLHMKKLRWFYGAFLKALDPFKNKVIACGNLLGKQSIMWKLLHRKSWKHFFYAILKSDGQPLWPDAWPIERIKADFEEYQEMGLTAKWFAEMMNSPTAGGGGVIDAHEICYLPPRIPEEIEYGFLTLDPAISKNKWADEWALTAHGWIAEESKWQVVENEYGQGDDPKTLFWRCVNMAKKWGFIYIGVESDAFQQVLEYYFDDLKYMHRIPHYQFVPVHSGNVKKPVRIATWAAMLKQTGQMKASYALTAGDFSITQELLDYQPMLKDNKDNRIDSAAYGVQMIDRYLFKIIQTLPGFSPGTVQTLYQVASI